MKPEKIDLDECYPCPRCKRGQIKAIILTEAFGCDRCNQIFGLAEENHLLEQLSTSYPYKKAWQWTGNHWRDDSRGLDSNYLPAALFVVLLPLVLLWVPASLNWPSGPSMVLYSILLLVPGLLFWLTMRQRR